MASLRCHYSPRSLHQWLRETRLKLTRAPQPVLFLTYFIPTLLNTFGFLGSVREVLAFPISWSLTTDHWPLSSTAQQWGHTTKTRHNWKLNYMPSSIIYKGIFSYKSLNCYWCMPFSWYDTNLNPSRLVYVDRNNLICKLPYQCLLSSKTLKFSWRTNWMQLQLHRKLSILMKY